MLRTVGAELLSLTLLCSLYASTARSEEFEGKCLSEMTRFDVCKAAKELQQEISGYLPMQMNSDMTLVSIAAIGPLVTLNIRWNLSDDQLREMLAVNSLTQIELERLMQKQTANYVCSQKVTSAFVGLGGALQYNYVLINGVSVASPIVSSCPS